jgi:polyphosphate kinase 2 (PPK2 family)
MSKEEQANRLLRRLEEEEHHVKFSAGDLKNAGMIIWNIMRRHKQDKYKKMRRYVVPADDKEMCRYIAEIIWNEMQKYTDIKNLN